MNTIGNLIWIIFGGAIIALEYLVSSFGLIITIVGIPFGIQHFKRMMLAFVPFVKEVVKG